MFLNGLLLQYQIHNQNLKKNLVIFSKFLLDLDYADDLSIIDESIGKINELLEVLRFLNAKIGLKINVKKIKSLRLGRSKDENVTLIVKRLIRWAASLNLVVLLVKTVGAVKMLKVE